MKTIKVLAGSVVRQEPQVLQAHLQLLTAQRLPKEIELDLAFIDDNENASSTELLAAAGNIIEHTHKVRPKELVYNIGDATHEWSAETFDHLAAYKQKLLDYTLKHDYDYFWLVDSDLLCEPTTLSSLLHSGTPIVSGVFWTSWQKGAEPMPQCWLRHDYELRGLGMEQHEFISSLINHKLVRCIGGGACCLIHRDVIESGAGYWPKVEGLPTTGMWQGEDRSFAVKAERRRIKQYADGWPAIFHAYHTEQRQKEVIDNAVALLTAAPQAHAKIGDWINFTVVPMQDPGLQEAQDPLNKSIRGKLGAMKVLPEIEEALFDMVVGDERIIELYFPSWYELQPYAGKSKLVLIKLIDIKHAKSRN